MDHGIPECGPRSLAAFAPWRRAVALLGLISALTGSSADTAYLAVWSCPDPPPESGTCCQLRLEAPVGSVFSIDLDLTYLPLGAGPVEVETGPLCGTMMLAANTGTPGRVQVALAGSSGVGGNGVILALHFPSTTGVTLACESALINEEALPVVALPPTSLVAPAAGATANLPATFAWSASGSFTDVRLGFATSETPGLVAVSGQPLGSTYTLTSTEWASIKTFLGAASTYYWTVGEAGSFHPAAAWRPVILRDPPPTATRLLAFDAAWFWPGCVRVSWETGVEDDLLGFRLERHVCDQTWMRVGEPLIPAHNAGRPTAYCIEETGLANTCPAEYRLVVIDRRGHANLAAQFELPVRPQLHVRRSRASHEFGVQGWPGAVASLEAASRLDAASWTPVRSIPLDGAGAGSCWLDELPGGSTSFYRLRFAP